MKKESSFQGLVLKTDYLHILFTETRPSFLEVIEKVELQ